MRSIAVLATAVLFAIALASPASAGEATLPKRLNLPPRPATALSGSELCKVLAPLPQEEREERILHEIQRGNVPEFLRGLVPIRFEQRLGGEPHTIEFYVTPDYLAIGSDTDFLRIPMTPRLAQWIADYLDCSLPTARLVDAIWENAEGRLQPQPIPPSPEMTTIATFCTHQQMIEDQRRRAGFAPGLLLVGTKKDIVITPELGRRPPPPRVAIYGWHYRNGAAIQPLSLVHKATYADYSHGVRLVGNDLVVDGVATRLPQLLRHPMLAALVSDEGAFPDEAHYAVSAPPAIWIADRELAP